MENRAGEEKCSISCPSDTECKLLTECAGGNVLQTAGGGETLERVYGQGEELGSRGIKEETEAGTVDRTEMIQIGQLKHRASENTYFLSRLYSFY